MIQAQSPIQDYVLSVYKHPEQFGGDNALFEMVENTVDILKSRLNSKGIDYTCQSLREEIWDLRFAVFEQQQQSLNVFFDTLHEYATTEIVNRRYDEDVLATVNSDALELYSKIILNFKNQIPEGESPLVQDFSSQKHLYKGLKGIKPPVGTNEISIVLNWIENSLDFECCLIINALIFSNELTVENDRRNSIANKLKQAIINMAFGASVLGFWHPDNEDETQYVRNVKILLADHELKKSNIPSYSVEEFRHLFAV